MVCNWVYDENEQGMRFVDVDAKTFHCPVCGAPKSAFVPEGITKGAEDIGTTVADKIVKQLEALGIKYIYGSLGDSNLPLIDDFRRSKQIRFILARHEETAAFMAAATKRLERNEK